MQKPYTAIISIVRRFYSREMRLNEYVRPPNDSDLLSMPVPNTC